MENGNTIIYKHKKLIKKNLRLGVHITIIK